MIKRLFGMHHLNITQGRWGSYSHKKHNAYDLAGSDSGIDYFKATCSLKVIGIHRFNRKNGTGFANTIHFYDEQNDVTLSMTHMNIVDGRWYVGKIFHTGEVCYMEGTTGRATGNHIHLEIGKGFQPRKVQFKRGQWGLKNWINFEDYFYLDDSITVISNPYPLEKKSGGTWDKEGEPMELKGIKEGLEQSLSIKGYKFHIYGVSDSEDVAVISAKQQGKENWEAKQALQLIDVDKSINCKINGGFFDMNSGQHYGVEQSETNDFAPKNANYLVFYEYLENGKTNWDWCGADSYTKSRAEVKWALTPFAIINKYGQIAYSRAYANEYNKRPHSRSLYMWLKTGKRALAICTSDISLEAVYDCLKDVAEVIVVFDGGGSTQMRAFDGVKTIDVFKSSRLIANAICAYTVGGGKPQYSQQKDSEIKANKEEMNNNSSELETLKNRVETLKKENENLKKDNIKKSLMLANIRQILEGNSNG